MVHQNDVLTAEAKVGDIAKLASHSLKEGEGIFPETQIGAAGESLLRARRKGRHKSFGRFVFAEPAHDVVKEQLQLRLAEET